MRNSSLVLPLGDPRCREVRLSGGKGGSLATMVQQGLASRPRCVIRYWTECRGYPCSPTALPGMATLTAASHRWLSRLPARTGMDRDSLGCATNPPKERRHEARSSEACTLRDLPGSRPIRDWSKTSTRSLPIYRRPRDLVPPNGSGSGFPNRGHSLRRTTSGERL
jgi:hypothetical protein